MTRKVILLLSLTPAIVWLSLGGLVIAVAAFAPLDASAIAAVKWIQAYGIWLALATGFWLAALGYGSTRRALKAGLGAWFLALVIAYPFVLAPGWGFGWGVAMGYGVVVLLLPASLGFVGLLRPKDPRNLWFVGAVLCLGWAGLETLARNLPGSPYTYQEANMQIGYQPKSYFVDSGYYYPLRLQENRKLDTWEERKPEFTQQVRCNEWGFHDRPWPKPGDKRHKLWLVLGDSFTQGVGAPQEQSWPRHLERLLHGATQDTSIRILNAGFGGSDPVLMLQVLDSLLEYYTPEVVLLAVNDSDIREAALRGPRGRKPIKGHFELYEYPFGFSFVFRYIFIRILGYDYDGLNAKTTAQRNKLGLGIIREEILRLNATGHEKGFQTWTFFAPAVYEMGAEPDTYAALVPPPRFINLKACYQTKGVNQNLTAFYWPIDRHHTPKGYQLMAQCIYESLPDSLKQAARQKTKR